MINSLNILAAAGEPGKFEVITQQFGVHTNLLVSQLIAFLIVCFVLKKFAFGPLQAMLEQRRNRIAEGEEKLKRIETQLAESEERTTAALEKANADAKRLIEEAKESAVAITEQKTQDAIASAQSILAKAQEAAKADRAAMVVELKQDFGKLVAATTTQVTGKVLSSADQKVINEEALAAVEG